MNEQLRLLERAQIYIAISCVIFGYHYDIYFLIETAAGCFLGTACGLLYIIRYLNKEQDEKTRLMQEDLDKLYEIYKSKKNELD